MLDFNQKAILCRAVQVDCASRMMMECEVSKMVRVEGGDDIMCVHILNTETSPVKFKKEHVKLETCKQDGKVIGIVGKCSCGIVYYREMRNIKDVHPCPL